MKHILKQLLLIVLIVTSSLYKTNAQNQAIDMNIGSPFIEPTPASYPGNLTLSFTMTAEILPQDLSSDDLSLNFAMVVLSLSNLTGSSQIMPTGTGAALFNWTYVSSSNSYIGTSKDVTMNADQVYRFVFTDVPVTAESNSVNTGFNVNLTPPGSLLAHQSNDDAASIYTAAPLPVTLVSFQAKTENNLVRLTWQTTQEENSDRFEIERSSNGKNWNKLGSVASHGESNVLRDYSFVDQTPLSGTNLYRLKIVDRDATYEYSRMESVDFRNANMMNAAAIYPNPSAGNFRINEKISIAKIELFNSSGSLISADHYKLGEGNSIQAESLLSGLYILKLQDISGVTTVHKLLITK